MARALQWIDRRLGTSLYYGQRFARLVNGRVASGPRRLKVALAGLLLSTERWPRPITLRLDGPHGPIPFRVPDWAGYRVLYEVFSLEEYDLELPTSSPAILDLGGHVGVSTLYFKRRWPEARVRVVEASPTLFALLEQNVGGLDGVEARHGAVAAQDGTTSFHEADASWAGTTGEGQGGQSIPSVALDTLLDQPFDLVKLDIEGAEFPALAAATRLDRAAVMVGEIHAPPGSEETRGALDLIERQMQVEDASEGVFNTLFRARARPAS